VSRRTLINLTFFSFVALAFFFWALTNLVKVDAIQRPYKISGTFTSAVFNAGRVATWGTVNWDALLPAGTSIQILTRSGNTATPDGTWSSWTAVPTSGGTVGSPARQYLQYEVILSTTHPTVTPTLLDITFNWT